MNAGHAKVTAVLRRYGARRVSNVRPRGRASPSGRLVAAFPGGLRAVDRADRRAARPVVSHRKAYFYDPTGENARAVKARDVGVCRWCGAYTQPRNGTGDAYAYCKACHPGGPNAAGLRNECAPRRTTGAAATVGLCRPVTGRARTRVGGGEAWDHGRRYKRAPMQRSFEGTPAHAARARARRGGMASGLDGVMIRLGFPAGTGSPPSIAMVVGEVRSAAPARA